MRYDSTNSWSWVWARDIESAVLGLSRCFVRKVLSKVLDLLHKVTSKRVRAKHGRCRVSNYKVFIYLVRSAPVSTPSTTGRGLSLDMDRQKIRLKLP